MEEDATFIFEWQKHAELQREAQQTTPSPSPSRTSLVSKLRPRRANGGKEAKLPLKDSPTIGIDLGTTNSAVAAVSGSKPFILASRDGLRVSPSVVSFVSGAGPAAACPRPLLSPSGMARVIVGENARRQGVSNRVRTTLGLSLGLGLGLWEGGSW